MKLQIKAQPIILLAASGSLLALLVLLPVIVSLHFLPQNKRTPLEYAQLIAGGVGDHEVIFSANLESDLNNFIIKPSDNKNIIIDTTNHFVTVKAHVVMQGAKMFEVDPAHVYLMNVEVNEEGLQNEHGSIVYAGFATFDANKKLETASPGTHRYFVSAGKISEKNVKTVNSWKTLTGIITGTGNVSYNTFRKTSKFAAPIVILNFHDPSAQVRIRKISVTKFK